LYRHPVVVLPLKVLRTFRGLGFATLEGLELPAGQSPASAAAASG
jgi:hypothetical protein